jgi:RimJ/RimL family protein N-acetyltransferase
VNPVDTVIATPRLLLRHFVEDDLEELAALMAAGDFMRPSSSLLRANNGEFLE